VTVQDQGAAAAAAVDGASASSGESAEAHAGVLSFVLGDREALQALPAALRIGPLVEAWRHVDGVFWDIFNRLCREFEELAKCYPEGTTVPGNFEEARKILLTGWSDIKALVPLIRDAKEELEKQGRWQNIGGSAFAAGMLETVRACEEATDLRGGNTDPAKFFFKKTENLMKDMLT
jgi:hypothetical protein